MSEKPPVGPRIVPVRAVPIELCQLLKFGGLAATGGEAKAVISAGKVLLNGTVETQKRKKLQAGDRVTCDGQTVEVRVG